MLNSAGSHRRRPLLNVRCVTPRLPVHQLEEIFSQGKGAMSIGNTDASASVNSSSEPRKWQPLTSRQRRVLGVLIEKAKTTPEAYPMTVNGLVAGSNQKSNRNPQMSLSSDDVEQILDELRGIAVVTEIQGSGRVPKYRHHAYEWLGVDKYELAVVTELLLRGEQTLGELRARAARMEPIADLAALKPIVDSLLKKGLMIELSPPGRGQMVSHGLYKDRELVELKAQFAGYKPSERDDDEPARPASGSSSSSNVRIHAAPQPIQASSPARPSGPAVGSVTADEFAELTVDVAELRAEISRLRDQINNLETKLQSVLG